MDVPAIQDRVSGTLRRLVRISIPADRDGDDEVSRVMNEFRDAKPRTLLAMESDWRVWLDWWDLADQSMPPGSGSAIAAFFEYLWNQGRKPTTVARTAFFIRRVFRLLDWFDSESEQEVSKVRCLAHVAAERRKWRPPQTTAFTWPEIQKCVAVADMRRDNEVRGIAALLLIYDTMAMTDDVFGYKRGREWFAAPLNRTDLVPMQDGSGILSINTREWDDGQRTIRLSNLTMKWIIHSFKFRKGNGGPLFASRSGVPWSMRGWIRIMKKIVARAGFDPGSFTSTSVRLGRVKDSLGEGMSVLDVCREGSWRGAEMVVRTMEQRHGPVQKIDGHGARRDEIPRMDGIDMPARQHHRGAIARARSKGWNTRQQELSLGQDFMPEPRQLPLALYV